VEWNVSDTLCLAGYLELMIFQQVQAINFNQQLSPVYFILCLLFILYGLSRVQTSGYLFRLSSHVSILLLTNTTGALLLQSINNLGALYAVAALVLVILAAHAVMKISHPRITRFVSDLRYTPMMV
jgi:hypothetical protein